MTEIDRLDLFAAVWLHDPQRAKLPSPGQRAYEWAQEVVAHRPDERKMREIPQCGNCGHNHQHSPSECSLDVQLEDCPCTEYVRSFIETHPAPPTEITIEPGSVVLNPDQVARLLSLYGDRWPATAMSIPEDDDLAEVQFVEKG